MMSPSSSKSFSFDGTAKESVNNFIYCAVFYSGHRVHSLLVIFHLAFSHCFACALYIPLHCKTSHHRTIVVINQIIFVVYK